jgi:hypothetical protein
MQPETTRRGRLLYVALAFLGLDMPPAAQPSGLRALDAWLDTWHGIGLIAHGLARQDRDLSLTRYRARWGVTVFVTGKEHAVVPGSASRRGSCRRVASIGGMKGMAGPGFIVAAAGIGSPAARLLGTRAQDADNQIR